MEHKRTYGIFPDSYFDYLFVTEKQSRFWPGDYHCRRVGGWGGGWIDQCLYI